MPFSRHRLRRPMFLEFDFASGCAAILWAVSTYWSKQTLQENEWLRALDFLSDYQWALFAGSFGIVQALCVAFNSKWGRWLCVLTGLPLWSTLTFAIISAVIYRGASLPNSASLYAIFAAFSFMCVVRLPHEFPPRAR